MIDITGEYFKLLFPVYVLNEDCSFQHYFVGAFKDDHVNSEWPRVTTKSLTNRNKDSMQSKNDNDKGVYKGLRVKYSCGGFAAGLIYPIYIIVSGLSKDELPKEEFGVIHNEGSSINGHIDPRNKEVGYMCLDSNVAQNPFLLV